MYLLEPGIAENVSANVKAEVEAYSKSTRDSRYQTRISPSSLGEECAAETFYKWRWATKPEESTGLMARYNQRGEDEEARIVKLLRATGWTIREYDRALVYHPESDSYFTMGWGEKLSPDCVDVSDNLQHIVAAKARGVKVEQFAVKAFMGHLYGKLDGLASHPVHTQGIEVLFENKFVNYKRFGVLTSREKPLPVADPKYYGQICVYMDLIPVPATMFVCGNRNDDDIEFRFFGANPTHAKELFTKANSVMFTKVRPARIAQSPAFYKCKFCDHKAVCHEGAPVEVSCRSCVNCIPIDDGKFHCEKWGKDIPNKAAIIAACGSHWPIE